MKASMTQVTRPADGWATKAKYQSRVASGLCGRCGAKLPRRRKPCGGWCTGCAKTAVWLVHPEA